MELSLKKDSLFNFIFFVFSSLIVAAASINFSSYGVLIYLILPTVLLFIYFAFLYRYLFYFLVFFSSIFYLETGDGITAYDLIYFLFVISYSTFIFIPLFISGHYRFSHPLDYLYLGFSAILIYGVCIGIIRGSNGYNVFGDAAYYLAIPTYFSSRKLIKSKQWSKSLILALFVFILFVVIRNYANYREIIINSIMQWQAENARSSSNEIIILFGINFFIALYLYFKKISSKGIVLVLIIVTAGALIITQSRGYWLALILSSLSMILISKGKERREIIISILTLALISSLLIGIFFYDKFSVVFDALLERFSSIGASKLDISLKERLFESQAVLDHLKSNPLFGYGLGTTYRRELLFFNYIEYRTFIHNGYLLVWFKFGLVGLTLFLFAHFYLLYKTFKGYNKIANRFLKLLNLSAFSLLMAMALVNNTSPQYFQFDTTLVFMMISILVVYSDEHYSFETCRHSL